jgi:predicted permease
MQDIRYALRTLRRDPGFAVFTVLIIGLGVGASATVFSVVNSLLVRPLPFNDPARLVWIANKVDTEDNMSGRTVQVIPMVEFRDRNQSFSDIAGYFAFYGTGDFSLSGQGESERLTAIPVSQKFFPLLGVQPQLGRQFTAQECDTNGPLAVLLSHGFWARHGSDPHIVGKSLRLNDEVWTVAGVMPASFDFGAVFSPGTNADLFYPFPLTGNTDRMGNTMAIVGRLKPGATLARAQAEADILGNQISDENRNRNSLHPKLTFLAEHVSGQIRPALLILASAVGVVMLIVCANLSNLMLARTAAREKEMAIRAALGAGRSRLVRQLFTESLVLTGGGALLGILIAFAATAGIAHLTAFKLPLLSSVAVDGTVLAFTVGVATITGMTLGLAPAWQVSAMRLNASLGRRGMGGSSEHTWLRGTLVVSEIAFACVLLVGAGLLIRSFMKVLDVQLGFQPERAYTMRIDPSSQYSTEAQKQTYISEALRRARDIPGVQAAGLADALPLGKNRTWGAGAKGVTYGPGKYPLAFVWIASDGYVKAMGMSVKQGRDLTEHDNREAAPVMTINETLAHNLWPGENPIGKFIVGPCAKEREVVGVVDDVRHMALEKESGAQMYIPMRQCGDRGSWDLVVRSSMPLTALAPAVEAALRPIAPNLPKGGMRPLTELVDRAVSPRRFIVLLLSGFAFFAVLLASLGIYGLISYSVNRRTQEIGIRMALGASTLHVQSRIVLRTLGLAGLGMMLGVVGSWVVVRAASGLLYGVRSADPPTFVAAALLLMGIAALAGYLPARRASRIDPMVCLRAE